MEHAKKSDVPMTNISEKNVIKSAKIKKIGHIVKNVRGMELSVRNVKATNIGEIHATKHVKIVTEKLVTPMETV